MCYITGQWGKVRVKNATLCLRKLFLSFFVVFHEKKLAFIIPIFAVDEASNFRDKILTNQKSELVVRNFQWNCMLVKPMLFHHENFKN